VKLHGLIQSAQSRRKGNRSAEPERPLRKSSYAPELRGNIVICARAARQVNQRANYRNLVPLFLSSNIPEWYPLELSMEESRFNLTASAVLAGVKLVIMPLIVYGLCIALGLKPLHTMAAARGATFSSSSSTRASSVGVSQHVSANWRPTTSPASSLRRDACGSAPISPRLKQDKTNNFSRLRLSVAQRINHQGKGR
jgi:hypothetical protein